MKRKSTSISNIARLETPWDLKESILLSEVAWLAKKYRRPREWQERLENLALDKSFLPLDLLIEAIHQLSYL